MRNQTLEPSAFKRGPGGRPSRQEAERRHLSLLATATRLFLEKGWDGASIDEISKASGVAKRFIYARYAGKAALFVGALERFIDEQMGRLHAFTPPPQDVERGLRAFGRRLLDLALRPEALAFHRLFIAEAPRFPDLAKFFVENNRHRILGEIVRVLAHYADRGAIELGDPEIRAEQFFIIVVGVPQRMALLVGRDQASKEEKRLKAAVRLFLDGCRKH
jgi:AcrR family transcriptional regulator